MRDQAILVRNAVKNEIPAFYPAALLVRPDQMWCRCGSPAQLPQRIRRETEGIP